MGWKGAGGGAVDEEEELAWKRKEKRKGVKKTEPFVWQSSLRNGGSQIMRVTLPLR